MASVLLTYASKNGSTKEIAERIHKTIHDTGIEIEILAIDEVKDIAAYDSVIIGSAVYMGQWMKEAVEFVIENKDILTGKHVWIYSSGPTNTGDPVELLKGWEYPESIKASLEQIKPQGIIVFHGKIIPDKLNFFQKMIIKMVKAPIGDFRDWVMIEKWAKRIGEEQKH